MNGLLVVCIWPSLPNLCKQIHFAHNPDDRLAVYMNLLAAFQPKLNPTISICLFREALTLCDQLNEPLIFCRLIYSVSPAVIAAAGYFQNAAQLCNAVFVTQSFDYPILQFHLLPASDRKFCKTSTCIRSLTNSLFSFSCWLSSVLRGRPLERGM